MSDEIPNFMLAPGWSRTPQTVSIIRLFNSFQAHFETGVQPESHLSQTSSTTYNSIFWVNVSERLVLSHRDGPKAPNFAKFAVAEGRQEGNIPTCLICPTSWKAPGQPPLWLRGPRGENYRCASAPGAFKTQPKLIGLGYDTDARG
jgi:hypothetical protein